MASFRPHRAHVLASSLMAAAQRPTDPCRWGDEAPLWSSVPAARLSHEGRVAAVEQSLKYSTLGRTTKRRKNPGKPSYSHQGLQESLSRQGFMQGAILRICEVLEAMRTFGLRLEQPLEADAG